jgi:chromosome segregation ATPase
LHIYISRELKRSQNNKRQAAQITQLETDLKAAEEKLKLMKSSTTSSSGKIDDSVVNDLIQEKSKLIVTRDKALGDLNKLQEQVDRYQKDKESWDVTRKEKENELKQLKASIEADKKQKVCITFYL